MKAILVAGDEITFRRGDRLWSLASLIMDTHVDDLDAGRIAEIEDRIQKWRLSHADGTAFDKGNAS